MFCRACLDGKYPIEIPDAAKLQKFAFEGVEGVGGVERVG